MTDELESTDELDAHEFVGMPVWSRGHTMKGTCIGTRRCTLEGCGGTRLCVRWPDGRRSWPCVKGMEFIGLRELEIQ